VSAETDRLDDHEDRLETLGEDVSGVEERLNTLAWNVNQLRDYVDTATDLAPILEQAAQLDVDRAKCDRCDGAVEIGPLAERIAAWENDVPREEVTYQQRKRVYTALQQSHLPKMDEAGALHYDSDRGVIEPADDLSRFDVYLEVVPRSELPRSETYLGLAAVCVALATVSWLGLFPFDLVGPLAWGGLFVAAFGTAALVHHRATRSLATDADTPPEDDR